MMQIAGFEKFSTVDFPGMLSAVVFTAGCNWNCWFCHNRAALAAETSISTAEVMQFLSRRAGLLDGVVVSGGEPTLQRDLPAFLAQLRGAGYRVKLDTNGSMPEVIEAVLKAGLADYVAVDFKARPDRYQKDTGCGDPGAVRETVRMLRAGRVPFEVRTTVIPGVDARALREICSYIGEVPLYALQLYRPALKCGADSGNPGVLEKLRNSMLDVQPHVVIRA